MLYTKLFRTHKISLCTSPEKRVSEHLAKRPRKGPGLNPEVQAVALMESPPMAKWTQPGGVALSAAGSPSFASPARDSSCPAAGVTGVSWRLSHGPGSAVDRGTAARVATALTPPVDSTASPERVRGSPPSCLLRLQRVELAPEHRSGICQLLPQSAHAHADGMVLLSQRVAFLDKRRVLLELAKVLPGRLAHRLPQAALQALVLLLDEVPLPTHFQRPICEGSIGLASLAFLEVRRRDQSEVVSIPNISVMFVVAV
eukprot:scaffold1850_cov194-Pinguiococcus_pyrenoidosus.AAC.39